PSRLPTAPEAAAPGSRPPRDNSRRPVATTAERPSGRPADPRPLHPPPPGPRPRPRKEGGTPAAARQTRTAPRKSGAPPSSRGGSRPAFNNPFAVLAKLKDQGKGGR